MSCRPSKKEVLVGISEEVYQDLIPWEITKEETLLRVVGSDDVKVDKVSNRRLLKDYKFFRSGEGMSVIRANYCHEDRVKELAIDLLSGRRNPEVYGYLRFTHAEMRLAAEATEIERINIDYTEKLSIHY